MDERTNKPKLPTTVGAFDAKTHLSALLERVANGETITITRHGKPVAKLVPARPHHEPPSPEVIARREAAIERLREAVKGNRLDGSLTDLIREGRRY